MRKILCLILVVVGLVACEKEVVEVSADETSYNVDRNRITVSGVSSGAYMAGQVHLAYSELFNGAALLAGGPYWCAEGTLSKGLGACMQGGDVALEDLLAYARDAAAAGLIDDLQNLSDDRVWVFHGANDAIVHRDASLSSVNFYAQFLAREQIEFIDDVAVAHGFPTLDSGVGCQEVAVPFLNACEYDAAGVLLATLYENLHDRGSAGGELRSISQPGADAAQMLDKAYLYVPAACSSGGQCGVHVAFHGCLQSSAVIADEFARYAGYNEWADSNELLILYPQVASSKIAPMNPNGCWDWWGYTGADYATQHGAQVAVVKATLDALAGSTL